MYIYLYRRHGHYWKNRLQYADFCNIISIKIILLIRLILFYSLCCGLNFHYGRDVLAALHLSLERSIQLCFYIDNLSLGYYYRELVLHNRDYCNYAQCCIHRIALGHCNRIQFRLALCKFYHIPQFQ